MLGLVLLYFIGKAFYKLAEKFNKSQWLYAILGIVFYYVGTIAGGLIAFIVLDLTGVASIDTVDDTALSLMGIPFGVLACWGGYKLIEKNWSKKVAYAHDDLLDDDFID